MIKVLILDDEKDVRHVLKYRIEKQFDCRIDSANNVESGIELCMRKRYDIIFVDYLYLGNIDGFNFLYDTKRKGEQNAVTVMISGFIRSLDEVKEKGMGILPDEFIPKPFPPAAIEGVIQRYFPESRKGRRQ